MDIDFFLPLFGKISRTEKYRKIKYSLIVFIVLQGKQLYISRNLKIFLFFVFTNSYLEDKYKHTCEYLRK